MTREKNRFRSAVFAICAIAALAIMYGCSGGGGSDSSTGTLKLSITDKQSDDFAKVIVAIREIRVVPTGSENAADNDPGLPVLARFNPAKVVDIMELQFKQELLGQIVLPAGNYSQIRLILEPNPNGNQPPVNYLTLNTDDTPIPLDTPSGAQSGLKVKGPIEVKAGVINAFMIDFDPNTAIVPRGNSGGYNLKPTGIRLIKVPGDLAAAGFGSILGSVSSTFKDWSSATVSIKRRGAINDSDPIAAGYIFSNYTTGDKWAAPFSAFVPTSDTVTYKTFIAANGFRLYSSQGVSVLLPAAHDLGEITLTPQ